jgi:hypothetical protein
MKVQLVTPYRVSRLQRYGVTVRGNVTSVDPHLYRHLHKTAALYNGNVKTFHLSYGLKIYFTPTQLLKLLV